MKRLVVFAAFFGLAAASQAQDDAGFYLGAGVGSAKEEFTGFSDEDTAFKILAGWSFNKYLAVELEYVDGGTQEDSVDGLEAAISSDGAIAALLARWPVNGAFAPYVKAGYAFYDTSIKVTDGVNAASESSSDSDPVCGGGLEFSFGKNFRLRAEFEKVDVPDAAFEIYSILATWRF